MKNGGRMSKKCKLTDLKVHSFKTNSETVKGGTWNERTEHHIYCKPVHQK